MDNTQNEAQLFINEMDVNTRDNILNLDRKIKSLRADIEVQLQDPDVQYKEQLTSVMNELEQATNTLNSLVSLVSGDDEEAKKELLQSPQMVQFSATLEGFLDKITQFKNEL